MRAWAVSPYTRTWTNVFKGHMPVFPVTAARGSHYPLSWWQGKLVCRYYGGSQEHWPFFLTWPSVGASYFLISSGVLTSFQRVSRHHSPFLSAPTPITAAVHTPWHFGPPLILVSTQVQAAAGASCTSTAGFVVFTRCHIRFFCLFRFLLK